MTATGIRTDTLYRTGAIEFRYLVNVPSAEPAQPVAHHPDGQRNDETRLVRCAGEYAAPAGEANKFDGDSCRNGELSASGFDRVVRERSR
jgi:hypothetical protein